MCFYNYLSNYHKITPTQTTFKTQAEAMQTKRGQHKAWHIP
jgi:hypothetical protein